MGRGVLLNKDKNKKSGPIEIIVGGALQPGWDKYIGTPQASAYADVWGGQRSVGVTSASAWSDNGGTDSNVLSGILRTSVRINFLPKCVGKTIIVSWYGKASARFWNSGGVYAYHTGGYIYSKSGYVDGAGATSTFTITQENWYFIISGSWDGWTSFWKPSCASSISYLAIQ